MRPLPSTPHVRKSRRRFVTFGTALILAACLTLVKMTLIVLDMNQGNPFGRRDPPSPQTPIEVPSPIASLDDSHFVPWPTVLPEPAAGPAEGEDGPASPFGDEAPIGDPMLAFDPSTLTEGQMQALQELAARRQELDERERLIDMRAELNARTEERLDQQISRLTALKERIEALVTDLDEDEERKMVRLVKIYETMKPKAAAEIFNRLEIPVLLHVIERMREAKSAVVLGKMNPAIAKRVTSELAKRKERPKLGGNDLGS